MSKNFGSGVLIGNWREDAYGKDLAQSRVAAPQVFAPTWDTTFRGGFRAPDRDSLVQKSLTPLEVCQTALSPVSFETQAAPLSLSTNIIAARPPADTIEACAIASDDLSVNTKEGLSREMIFEHNQAPTGQTRYQTSYSQSIGNRPFQGSDSGARSSLLEAKQKQWAIEKQMIVRTSSSVAQSSNKAAFEEEALKEAARHSDDKFRARSTITRTFTGAEFAAAKLLR